MCDIVKNEFKLKKFGFYCTNRESLYKCQWKWHPVLYISIRVVMALYSVGALVAACVLSADAEKVILIYLTIWTYILLTLHLCMTAVLAIVYKSRAPVDDMQGVDNPQFVKEKTDSSEKPKQGPLNTLKMEAGIRRNINSSNKTNEERINTIDDNENIRWFLKLPWLLGDILQSFAIVVTLVYFVFLFPTMEEAGSYNDINVHGLNTVMMLIDFFISARPVYLLHFIYPVIYGLVYIIFNVIYWSFDHTNNVIYSVLDWNSPTFAIVMVVLLALVIIPLFQTIFFGLYRLKLKIYHSLYEKM